VRAHGLDAARRNFVDPDFSWTQFRCEQLRSSGSDIERLKPSPTWVVRDCFGPRVAS
jgi:hypothetical protein